jgi:hypothetical protein
VHALPPQRGMASTGTLSAGLFALILLTGALLFLSFRPSADARFSVAPLQAATCPSGSGVPVCYTSSVKNDGTKAAAVKCVLTPGPGSNAIFDTGSGTLVSPGTIPPAGELALMIKVDAASGGIVTSPTLDCSSA